MSLVTITESYLTAIGNAIRAKLGTSAAYTPAQMAGAIESIPTASPAVLVAKTITANGTYDPADDDADGYSSVTVNVSGGGGGTSGILAGTVAPTADQGSTGDVYLQYIPIGSGALSHTYVLTIISALRGASALTYAGATEIDLIFDDGAGGEVSIRDLSGFTYSARVSSGSAGYPSAAFDGSTSSYWEAYYTPITLNMTATIPAGYTPKTLKVMQRSSSYTTDVWKDFTLEDTAAGVTALLVEETGLSVSDWAGALNYTEFACGPGVAGNAITNYYVKGSGGWAETTQAGALNAILAQIV